MTVITDAHSVLAAGASDAELDAMCVSAAAFLEQFTGGRTEYLWPPDKAHYMGRADLFSALAEPFSLPPRGTARSTR